MGENSAETEGGKWQSMTLEEVDRRNMGIREGIDAAHSVSVIANLLSGFDNDGQLDGWTLRMLGENLQRLSGTIVSELSDAYL